MRQRDEVLAEGTSFQGDDVSGSCEAANLISRSQKVDVAVSWCAIITEGAENQTDVKLEEAAADVDRGKMSGGLGLVQLVKRWPSVSPPG